MSNELEDILIDEEFTNFHLDSPTADMGPEKSAKFSTTFDYGGILGAIAAGAISDYTNKPATTCAGMLIVSIPTVS